MNEKSIPLIMDFFDWFYSRWNTSYLRNKDIELPEFSGFCKQQYLIEEDRRTEFTNKEKEILRPIAETLALLDGNAFFTMDNNGKEWYEMYLPEANMIYQSNGGDYGWAGEASFAKRILDLTNK